MDSPCLPPAGRPWAGLGGGRLSCLREEEVGELKPGAQALSGLNLEQPSGVPPQ